MGDTGNVFTGNHLRQDAKLYPSRNHGNESFPLYCLFVFYRNAIHTLVKSNVQKNTIKTGSGHTQNGLHVKKALRSDTRII